MPLEQGWRVLVAVDAMGSTQGLPLVTVPNHIVSAERRRTPHLQARGHAWLGLMTTMDECATELLELASAQEGGTIQRPGQKGG